VETRGAGSPSFVFISTVSFAWERFALIVRFIRFSFRFPIFVRSASLSSAISVILYFASLAVLKGRQADDFLERFVEVGQILESARFRDGLNFMMGLPQLLLGFPDPQQKQVFAKVKAGDAFEDSAQVGGADEKLLRDLVERRLLVKMDG